MEETNRVNRERCTSGAADRKELGPLQKKIDEIVTAIHEAGFSRALTDRLHKFEARREELKERRATVPLNISDIHPNIAGICRRKVARHAEALRKPEDRDVADSAIRGLIERIALSDGEKNGDIQITLCGDLGTILGWTGNGAEKEKTDMLASGMSVEIFVQAAKEL